ncbi:hypothetical protein EW146_g1456 [Bondarzewia mesenterica]|uniref:C2H2-type domain-containing protein n=1 Tax=Bondarzewia mesenterica TaxID=1095465 RepID=A0A4S4M3W1_9AGAM|nr:hypothetical protein EW146_g1456 [Bondarzewia mesenterica]
MFLPSGHDVYRLSHFRRLTPPPSPSSSITSQSTYIGSEISSLTLKPLDYHAANRRFNNARRLPSIHALLNPEHEDTYDRTGSLPYPDLPPLSLHSPHATPALTKAREDALQRTMRAVAARRSLPDNIATPSAAYGMTTYRGHSVDHPTYEAECLVYLDRMDGSDEAPAAYETFTSLSAKEPHHPPDRFDFSYPMQRQTSPDYAACNESQYERTAGDIQHGVSQPAPRVASESREVSVPSPRTSISKRKLHDLEEGSKTDDDDDRDARDSHTSITRSRMSIDRMLISVNMQQTAESAPRPKAQPGPGKKVGRPRAVKPASKPSSKKCGRKPQPSGEPPHVNENGVKLEVIELPFNYDSDEWKKYAVCDGPSEKGPWKCTYGHPVTHCDKESEFKSQSAIKRHIEGTHLKITPFQCSWCLKKFTQRHNLTSCHFNVHTGERPHVCPYDDCNMSFKDPAKKHRHKVAVHNYAPDERKGGAPKKIRVA